MNHLRPLILCLIAATSLPVLPAAETQDLPATEITSVALEMWRTDTETHAIFTGNVTVTGNQMKLTCDRLELIASTTGDKTDTVGTLDQFKYLLATGKVNIVQADREASCGRAEVFPREEKIILTEKPVVTDHSNNIVATGEPLILLRGERRVIGEHVRFTGPPMKDLSYDKKPPSGTAPAESSPTVAPTTPASPPKK